LQVEYTVRHVRGRILDVAGTADLEQFELPAFYDRLKRAVEQGLPAPLQISMGLLGLVNGVVGILGITLALATIQPVLLPIVAVACIPRWLVSKRNIDEMYQFRFGHTPDERARFYLETLLHERDPAKEVRAFSLFGFLKRRWTVLYARRIDELAAIARRHVRRTVIASVVSSTVIAAMLLLLVTLFVEGQMDIAGVATAGLALQQLGSRLQGSGAPRPALQSSRSSTTTPRY
jgi:ATP-binding cassette subfamily B protein